jgi:Dyp-type peroxidase family
VISKLDLADIQGLLASGYARQRYGRFMFLRIKEVAAAKHWLAQVAVHITPANWRNVLHDAPPHSHANIAFTASGLRLLGLGEDAMGAFPREFLVGMALRANILGDEGESEPDMWEFGGRNGPEVHVFLMLYASESLQMEELAKRFWQMGLDAGLDLVFWQDSLREDAKEAKEPFGFHDGISQPYIEGLQVDRRTKPLPGQNTVKAGEFILGYPNEYDQLADSPTVPATLVSTKLLAPSSTGENRRDFGRNGSFLVVRKLEQDVAGFKQFFEQRATRDGVVDKQRRDLLMAKFMGRWPSGAPLVLAPQKDDEPLGASKLRNNDFNYAGTDRNGFLCPIGSHVRRCNPRDVLTESPSESLHLMKRHRIVRRGRPYHEPPEVAPEQAVRRGLMFIALNADFQRQFEFIQRTWINNPNFAGLCDNKDPIVGNNDRKGAMVIQDQTINSRVHGLPRFVTVKGGGYFFMPGKKALLYLAQ